VVVEWWARKKWTSVCERIKELNTCNYNLGWRKLCI